MKAGTQPLMGGLMGLGVEGGVESIDSGAGESARDIKEFGCE